MEGAHNATEDEFVMHSVPRCLDNQGEKLQGGGLRGAGAVGVGDGGLCDIAVGCGCALAKSAGLLGHTRLTRGFYNRGVMSGDHRDCGICLTRFDDTQGVTRHVLWPCQHARQCGECALKIWKTPKPSRRCPWCKAKMESRPRPFAPFV